jgi:pimeloyl-ACP methyl ester carboxylesterase
VRNLVLDAQPPRELARLRIPIVLVAGEDDPVVDVDHLRALSARHANVRVEFWPGGHDLPLSAATRCTAAIRAWVATT